MSAQTIDVQGRRIALLRAGTGAPLLYLHGFADIHGASAAPMTFHDRLAKSFDLIAPAHPGCAGSDERDDLDSVQDVVEEYLDLVDALGLDSFHLAGSCVGGWVAAAMAVREPARVKKLVLIGPTGLFVSGKPIGDIFWVAQPEDGIYYNDLRRMLFAGADSAIGKTLFPDGRGDIPQEMLRYKMFRFASQVGFTPPYLYDRKLRDQLHRYGGPALILWGEHDHMVPQDHGNAYAEGFPHAQLRVVQGAGHSVAAEKPDETAKLIADFLGG